MARSSRILLALAALPLALACNGIIGLSDYSRAECSGGGVCVDASDFDAASAIDAPFDGPVIVAPGVGPVSWAHFPMPNYAQDGGPTVNIQTYTMVTGEGWQDNVTKTLVWRYPTPMSERGLKTFADAQKICAAVAGKWRLPTRIELVSLLDLGATKAAIDPKFDDTELSAYWTTSEVRPVAATGPRSRWVVRFAPGGSSGLDKVDESQAAAAVRCIKDKS